MVAMIINSPALAALRAARPPRGAQYVMDWWESALFYALAELAENEGGPQDASITELGRVLGAITNGTGGTAGTLHAALLRLRTYGLARADADPWTARRPRWSLTPKGKELAHA